VRAGWADSDLEQLEETGVHTAILGFVCGDKKRITEITERRRRVHRGVGRRPYGEFAMLCGLF